MLQALLEERFGLRTHAEPRQMTHYVLQVARPDGRLGAQLVKNTNECTSPLMKLSGVPPGAAAMAALPSFRGECTVLHLRHESRGLCRIPDLLRQYSSLPTAPPRS